MLQDSKSLMHIVQKHVISHFVGKVMILFLRLINSLENLYTHVHKLVYIVGKSQESIWAIFGGCS